MDKIAVLIPCYNEEKTIENVVREFKRELPEAVIYVYDNNSTDKSMELAKYAGAVVRIERAQGKGNVIRRMFREIDAEVYIMVDADNTYNASAARQMVDYVCNHQADMVVGDRLSSTYYQVNTRPFHNFGNMLVQKSINYLFHSKIKDIMTGYRAFSYEFVKTFPVLTKGFEIETEMTIHAIDKNMKIEQITIDYQDRPQGSESKLNTYSDGLKVLATIIKLFSVYKPMKFYGVIGMILFLIAFLMMIPVMNSYLRTGLVMRFPTLIVCGFMVIAGIQAFFSGMILHNLRQKNRQDFEFRLQSAHDNYEERRSLESEKGEES